MTCITFDKLVISLGQITSFNFEGHKNFKCPGGGGLKSGLYYAFFTWKIEIDDVEDTVVGHLFRH